ncbi:hypothetical protein T06_9936 [Trichinella sp. T6]|nr:hypothetical protein T06_9936 [Trichinella sp. T6]
MAFLSPIVENRLGIEAEHNETLETRACVAAVTTSKASKCGTDDDDDEKFANVHVEKQIHPFTNGGLFQAISCCGRIGTALVDSSPVPVAFVALVLEVWDSTTEVGGGPMEADVLYRQRDIGDTIVGKSFNELRAPYLKWVFMWTFKLSLREKYRPQTSHGNGLSPLC